MKTTFKLFSIIVFVFFYFSCGKSAIKEDEKYIGYWANRYSPNACCLTIKIYDDAQAYINIDGDDECKCNSNPCHSGKARVKNNQMNIGTKTLSIDVKPMAVDTIKNIRYSQGNYDGRSAMIMVLDGDTLYKIIGQ